MNRVKVRDRRKKLIVGHFRAMRRDIFKGVKLVKNL